jgi:hypothetical protein
VLTTFSDYIQMILITISQIKYNPYHNGCTYKNKKNVHLMQEFILLPFNNYYCKLYQCLLHKLQHVSLYEPNDTYNKIITIIKNYSKY